MSRGLLFGAVLLVATLFPMLQHVPGAAPPSAEATRIEFRPGLGWVIRTDGVIWQLPRCQQIRFSLGLMKALLLAVPPGMPAAALEPGFVCVNERPPF